MTDVTKTHFIVFDPDQVNAALQKTGPDVTLSAYYNTKGSLVIGTKLTKKASSLVKRENIQILGHPRSEAFFSATIETLRTHDIATAEDAQKFVKKMAREDRGPVVMLSKDQVTIIAGDEDKVKKSKNKKNTRRLTNKQVSPERKAEPKQNTEKSSDAATAIHQTVPASAIEKSSTRMRISKLAGQYDAKIADILMRVAREAGRIDPDMPGNSAESGMGSIAVFERKKITGAKIQRLVAFCENKNDMGIDPVVYLTACAAKLQDGTDNDEDNLLNAAFGWNKSLTVDMVLDEVKSARPNFCPQPMARAS